METLQLEGIEYCYRDADHWPILCKEELKRAYGIQLPPVALFSIDINEFKGCRKVLLRAMEDRDYPAFGNYHWMWQEGTVWREMYGIAMKWLTQHFIQEILKQQPDKDGWYKAYFYFTIKQSS